jgi:hypothetical protein
MKAICTQTLLKNTIKGIFLVEEGEVIDYTVSEKQFIIRDVAIPDVLFFNHFKVTEGFEKMTYSDFEYILCNYVFRMAVLFPEEYNGIRSLIIQDWDGSVIMITVNKKENIIRVSFDNMQEKYSSYEEALDGIKNHK